jgi:hypothetical protein
MSVARVRNVESGTSCTNSSVSISVQPCASIEPPLMNDCARDSARS